MTGHEALSGFDLDAVEAAIDELGQRGAWSELAALVEEIDGRARRSAESGVRLSFVAEHARAWAHTWTACAAREDPRFPHESRPAFRRAAYLSAYRDVCMRGEAADGARLDPSVFAIPFALEPWEPRPLSGLGRPLALSDLASCFAVGEVALMRGAQSEGDEAPCEDVAHRGCAGLLSLVEGWGLGPSVTAFASSADPLAAMGQLALEPVLAGEVSATMATHLMVSAAEGRAPYAPKRGVAKARLRVHRTLAAMAELPWPPDAAELRAFASGLRFFAWSERSDEHDALNLVVIDREGERSWAIGAQTFD